MGKATNGLDDNSRHINDAKQDPTGTSSRKEPQMPNSNYPVDGGWAWAVVFGSFGIHFFTFGYVRSFGILFLEFQAKHDSSSTMTAVITGVQFTANSLSLFLAVNVLLKHLSIRQCCLIGCVLECLGIALSGVVPDIHFLILTQGILFGSGHALLYCPCLMIVSEYFKNKRAIATVIATCGVSFGGVTLPVLIRYLMDNYGLTGGLLLLAAIMFNQAVCSALFTPISKYQPNLVEKHDEHGKYQPNLVEKYDEHGKYQPNLVENHVEHGKYQPNLVEKHDEHGKYQPNILEKHDEYGQYQPNIMEKHNEHGEINSNFSMHDLSQSSPGLDTGQCKVIYAQTSPNYIKDTPSNFSIPSKNCQDTSRLLQQCSCDLQQCVQSHVHSDQVTPCDRAPKCNLVYAVGKSNEERDIPGNDVDSSLNMQFYSNELKHSRSNLDSFLSSSQTLLRSEADVLHTSVTKLENQTNQKTATSDNSIVNERNMANNTCLQDTVFNSLSTSAIDIHGSLYSLTQLGAHSQTLSRHSSEQRRNENVHEVSKFNRKTRWRCRVPVIVKTASFWIVLVYYASGGVASGLPVIFLPPLAKEKGIADYITILLMASSVTELIGRLVPGLIIHGGAMRPTSVVIAPIVACATLYQFTSLFNDVATLLTMSLLSGLFTGAFWSTQSLILIEIFGIHRLGKTLGFYLIVLCLSTGSSNPISGFLRDISGTYVATFHYFGALYFLAALMMIVSLFIKHDSSKSPDDA